MSSPRDKLFPVNQHPVILELVTYTFLFSGSHINALCYSAPCARQNLCGELGSNGRDTVRSRTVTNARFSIASIWILHLTSFTLCFELSSSVFSFFIDNLHKSVCNPKFSMGRVFSPSLVLRK